MALAVATTCIGSRARADAAPLPKLHLAYEISGRVEACPDEAAFRRHVALRLGYDPFVSPDSPAPRQLTVSVKETAPRSVFVTLLDASGKVLGRRVLGEPPPGCEELVASAAFAASVAIDPSVVARGSASPEASASPTDQAPVPAPRPVEPPALAAPAAPAAPAAERPRAPAPAPKETALSVRLGASSSFGVLPATAFGISLGASLRRAALSVGLEGRYDLPAESDRAVADGADGARVDVRASLIAGSVHACGHLGAARVVPYACTVLFAGAFRGASSGISAPKEDVSAYVAAGPRFGAALGLSQALSFDLRIDVPFALAAVELRVDDRAVWTSPAVAAVAGAGLSLVLP